MGHQGDPAGRMELQYQGTYDMAHSSRVEPEAELVAEVVLVAEESNASGI